MVAMKNLSTQSNRATLKLYTPHDGQRQLHRSKTRFNAVCFGRQSGKTTYGLNKIADRAWRGPRDGIYWYILQTYDAAQVAFTRVMQWYLRSPQIFSKKPNESDFSCQFHHGPTFSFKSGKNYQDLRVETLDGVIIDEYRQQHPSLWPMVIRPMLAKKEGWGDILSTPNGFEHFFDIFEAAKADAEWNTFHAPSTIAPWWTEKEVASAKSVMTEAEFAQEIMAEFRDLHVGKAYLTHGPHNWSIHNPFCRSGLQWSEPLPIVVGLDFNVGSMAWELGQQRGTDWYWGDEIWVKNTNTQECAKILVEKVKNHKAGVILCGDATGNARKTSAAGATDYTILAQALTSNRIKWEDRTPAVNPSIKDRVNTVCSKLRSADGSIHMWLNPDQCPHLKTDLQRVSWKQGTNMILDQTTNPELTHASDAIGYPIVAMDPMLQSGSVGVMRILR